MENRLVAVTNTVSGRVTRFTYDADGQQVQRVDVSGTVAYIGAHAELNQSTGWWTTYYSLGSRRVAMRQTNGANPAQTMVYWLHSGHLGSTSLTTNITGTRVSELRYTPFGETRWSSGTTPTDGRFTRSNRRKWDRAALVWCQVPGSDSWPVHQRGYHRAPARRSAEPQQVLVRQELAH